MIGIIVGSLMYVYVPYYYILTYSILCLVVGSVFFMNATATTWRLWLLAMNAICILYSIRYFNYEFKPAVTIMIMSLGIYIATYYLSHWIGTSNRVIQSLMGIFGYVLVNFCIWLAYIPIHIKQVHMAKTHMGKLHIPSTRTIYHILAWIGIVCSILGLGVTPFIPYRFLLGVYLIILASIFLMSLLYILNQPSIYPGKSSPQQSVSNTKTVDIGKYAVVISAEKMAKVVRTPYTYSIGFNLVIVPTTGANKDVTVMTINNNLDIRYNTETGILSFWGIPEGTSTEFVGLYRNYIIPVQTWVLVSINILDGKVDIGINNTLKNSTEVILKNQPPIGPLTVGDKTVSWVKGFVKNIQITNRMYIL